MNKKSNPKMIKEEERRNPNEGVLLPKPHPNQVYNTYIYKQMENGPLKGQKMVKIFSFFHGPTSFFKAKAPLPW